MRAEGIEPPRAEAHRDLNPARLPISPRPRGWFTAYRRGYAAPMSESEHLTSPGTVDDPELERERAEQAAERERESRESDQTKFEEESP